MTRRSAERSPAAGSQGSSSIDADSSLDYFLSARSDPLQAVIETPVFASRARKLMDELEIVELVNAIAANPTMGEIIQGTGGARKLRWARKGQGKSGGYRIISFFHSEAIPVFLLDIYGKNEKSNLTDAEKNALGKILGRIVDAYRKGAKGHAESRRTPS